MLCFVLINGFFFFFNPLCVWMLYLQLFNWGEKYIKHVLHATFSKCLFADLSLFSHKLFLLSLTGWPALHTCVKRILFYCGCWMNPQCCFVCSVPIPCWTLSVDRQSLHCCHGLRTHQQVSDSYLLSFSFSVYVTLSASILPLFSLSLSPPFLCLSLSSPSFSLSLSHSLICFFVILSLS